MMPENISIAGVSERDIDLLLLEEFLSSTGFDDWFVQRTIGHSLGDCINAQKSVADSTGESDLEVTFSDSQERRTKLLIEDKVGAQLQPRQAERYRSRGDGYIARGLCVQYQTIIVAPSCYFSGVDDVKGFDFRISYEEIREWFEQAVNLGSRRDYKLALLRAAIEKGTVGYQHEEDAAVTKFWHDYWLYSCKHAPDLGMNKPIMKAAGADTMQFNPYKLPNGPVYLMHKSSHGYVDLQFMRLAIRFNDFYADTEPLLTDGMTIQKTGGSVSVRLMVPPLSMNSTAQAQEREILAGFQSARRLIEWFCSNKNSLDKYVGETQIDDAAIT